MDILSESGLTQQCNPNTDIIRKRYKKHKFEKMAEGVYKGLYMNGLIKENMSY